MFSHFTASGRIYLSQAYDLVATGDIAPLIVTLALSWYVASWAVQHSDRLRIVGSLIGLSATLLFLGCGIGQGDVTDTSELLSLTFRALIAGGLSTAIAWMFLPVLSSVLRHAMAKPVAWIWSSLRRSLSPAINAWKQRRIEHQRRLEAEHQQPEWERARIELERDARKQALRKKRLEEARLQCELHYNRHFGQIKEVLPEERFRKLLDTYLSSTVDSLALRKRAQMIIDMIDAASVDDSSHSEFQSIADAVAHFTERKQELSAIGLEPDEIESLVMFIDTARDRAIERILAQ